MTTNSTALAIFDPAQLPAHIATVMEDGGTNIAARLTTDQITFAGKVWAMSVGGNKKALTRKNEEGEEEPVQIFSVVMLQYPQRRGRAYYPGAYDPQKESAPECWSNDGIDSAVNATVRHSLKCATCKLSAKNSKVVDGKGTTACSQHRMTAVIPSARIGDFAPLRMKLAITSDFDARNEKAQQQGWFGFQQYTDLLKTKGVNYTYLLTTRMKFDPDANYPKLLFSPGKWLTPEQLEEVKAILVRDQGTIDGLLKTEFTPARTEDPVEAVDDELAETEEEQAAAAAQAPAPKTAPKAAPKAAAPAPAAAVVEDELEEIQQPAPAPAKAPKANGAAPAVDARVAQAAAVAAKRKAAAAAMPETEEDGDAAPAAPKAAAPKAGATKAPATPPVAASPALSAVLSDWDDE